MIVRWPGGKKGHIDEGLHYNLDLLPTLAELFGAEASPRWDGRSYAASITEGAECGREHLVISQCAHVAQRSVVFGPWLYMRTYHDGFHPYYEREMLFNREDDVHLTRDLAGDRRDLCLEGAYRLLDWHDTMMATMPFKDKSDPLWTVIRERGPEHATAENVERSRYFERLKKTGRGGSIDEIVARHPELKRLRS